MIEGLWIVQYHGPPGTGGGVVVFVKGQVLGGDSGFTYSGSYDLTGELFKAKVEVQNFDPSMLCNQVAPSTPALRLSQLL